MSLGVPLKVLREAEGHIITVESVTNELFRGTLLECEDNMNIQMTNINFTGRDGKTAHLDNAYIRGNKIRFIILPDMLKNVPMLKTKSGTKGLGSGRGKTAMLRQGLRGRGRGHFNRGRGFRR